ncbi:MAG: cadmium-translocating P-type ATPase [Clostridia bacterium]|nr:cadmium-translocating P-type ATPase [Clostridia bacterium]
MGEKKHCHEHEHHGVHEHEHEHEHHHCHSHGECCESGCSCGHEHNHEISKLSVALSVCAAALIGASFLPFVANSVSLFYGALIISALLSGHEVYVDAFREIVKLKIGEHFLLLVAVVAAFCIGEAREAAAVALFFSVGEIFESLASARSEKSLRKLTEIKADTAHLLKDGSDYETVGADEVKEGDVIVILPFERIPADCEVIEGISSVDASAITGESLPVEASPGKKILSGCINNQGRLSAKVLKAAGESTASRIVELARDNAARKGSSEKLITRFAEIYTPVVIIIGLIIAIVPSIITKDWTKWIKSGLVFIVASCPCALVISIPLGFFSGIGLASKNAIIIKGGTFIEKLAKASVVCVDKTGTLTDGKLDVTDCIAFNGFMPQEVKKYAYLCEKSSSHPIAVAVRNFCTEHGGEISSLKEYPGRGVEIVSDGKTVVCGGEGLMRSVGVEVEGKYPVFIAVDGVLAGAFDIESNLREDSPAAIRMLKEVGIKKTVMLTGDNEEAARSVSEQCGIDEHFSGLLPNEKSEKLKAIAAEYGSTIYVGDGINDVPVIAQSDVGVAMGLGSEAAIETADVVLMSERISDLSKAIKISSSTMKVVYFNIVFALGVKAIVLLLALFGHAFMSLAVFADVGVSIIAIVNSSRLLAKRMDRKKSDRA